MSFIDSPVRSVLTRRGSASNEADCLTPHVAFGHDGCVRLEEIFNLGAPRSRSCGRNRSAADVEGTRDGSTLGPPLPFCH